MPALALPGGADVQQRAALLIHKVPFLNLRAQMFGIGKWSGTQTVEKVRPELGRTQLPQRYVRVVLNTNHS